RMNAVFDRRSDRWIRSYVRLRLAEFDGTLSRTNDQNLYMRSGRVDTDRPLTDWYRTLRSNGFEERVFNRSGIYFTSAVDANGRVRPAMITIGGQQRPLNTAGQGVNITSLNNAELNSFFNGVDDF